MRFKIFFEADMGGAPGAPPGGMGMGGPPMGGAPGGSPLGGPMGAPPGGMGGPLGAPGGGGGMGLGMDGGLGGPMGGQPPAGGDMTQVPIDVTTTSVWDIFEKLLSGSNLPKEKLSTPKPKTSHLMQ